MTHFDQSLGTKPYAKDHDEGVPSTLREKERKPPLLKSAYRGWPFEYDPSEVGTLAPASFEVGRVTPRPSAIDEVICPMCHKPFVSRRADHIYCSPSCRRKGSRRGREAVNETMESDSFMRRCEAPACSNSLIGKREGTRYCSTKCRVRANYHKGGSE